MSVYNITHFLGDQSWSTHLDHVILPKHHVHWEKIFLSARKMIPRSRAHSKLICPTHVHQVSDASNHLVLYCLLLLLPSIFPSIRVFSNESVLHIRWPRGWSFSFSISPSNEYSGLISFRMDWLDLLAVQGTLKSLLQHHSSKASILWCSAFFIVQLSHPDI